MSSKTNMRKCAVISANLLPPTCASVYNTNKMSVIAPKENVIYVEKKEFLEIRYLRFSENYGKNIDTSRRYIHVGGARNLWRTQREWINKVGDKRLVAKGNNFMFKGISQCNKQIKGIRGPSLPSNVLPPLKFRSHNDAIKADKSEYRCELPEDDPTRDLTETDFGEIPQYFQYLKNEYIDPAVKEFCYDAFLSDSDNEQLIVEFKRKLGLGTKYVTQSADPTDFTTVPTDVVHHPEPIPIYQDDSVTSKEFVSTEPNTEPNPFAEPNTVYPPPPNSEGKPIKSNGFFSELSELPTHIHDFLTNTTEKLDSVHSTFENLTSYVSNAFSKLLDNTVSAYNITQLASTIVNLIYDVSNYELYSLPILIFKVGHSLANMFLTYLPKVFPAVITKVNFQSQSFTSIPSHLYKFLSTFTNANAIIHAGRFANAINQLKIGMTNVKLFASWVYSHMPKFLTDLIEYFLPSPKTFDTRYKEFVGRIVACHDSMTMRRAIPQAELDHLISEIHFFDTFLLAPNDDYKFHSPNYRYFRNYLSKIHFYINAYTNFNTPRKCPFAIVFTGESRAGKTVLMSHISNTLARIYEWNGPVMYVRNPGCETYDGYSSDTMVVAFDDWLQSTEYDDVPEFFSLVTKQHYIVPMAAIDDPMVGIKGTLCLSPFVMACTNVENLDAVSTKINSPMALAARINLRVHVTRVSDSYDMSGNFKHHSYRVYGKDGKLDTKSICFEQLMEKIVKMNEAHLKTQDGIDMMLDQQETLIDKLKKMRSQGSFSSLLYTSISAITDLYLYSAVGTFLNNLSKRYKDYTEPIYNQPKGYYALKFVAAFALVLGAVSYFKKTAVLTNAVHNYTRADTLMCQLSLMHNLNEYDNNSLCYYSAKLSVAQMDVNKFSQNTVRIISDLAALSDDINKDKIVKFMQRHEKKLFAEFISESVKPKTYSKEELSNLRGRADKAYFDRYAELQFSESRNIDDKNYRRPHTVTESQNSESRTIDDKNYRRPFTVTESQYSESRNIDDKNYRRPFTVTESRSLDDKNYRRPQTRTENADICGSSHTDIEAREQSCADPLDVMKHSKFNSPFFKSQEILQKVFPDFIDNIDSIDHIVNYTSEGTHDPMAVTVSHELVKKVIPVSLLCSDTTSFFAGPVTPVNYVNAIPIAPQVYLMPKHLFYGLDGQFITNTRDRLYRLVFRINGVNHSVDFTPSRYHPLLNSSGQPTIDGVLYDLSSTSVPAVRPQLDQFICDKDLSKINNGDHATMIGHSLSSGQPLPYGKTFTIKPLKSTITYEHAPNLNFTLASGFIYDAATISGDCGSPIVIHNPQIPTKLIGIHVLGSAMDTTGGATFVTQEMLRRSLPKAVNNSKIQPLDVSFRVTSESEKLRSFTK